METPGTPEVTAPERGAPTDRSRRRLVASALLLVLLLVVADLAGLGLRGTDPAAPPVTSGSSVGVAGQDDEFIVSSTVTALPACSVAVPLAPGVDRCLVYAVHNPGPLPIIVMTISVASVEAAASCPAAYLDVDRATFTGELAVPAGATVTAPGVPLALRSDAAMLDACKGAVFSLDYTGTARYGVAAP
jgi:hypothetical protein